MSSVESDALDPAPEALVCISDRLSDRSILIYALLENPVCKRIIPRAFSPLNNIKTDPSAILAKTEEELAEAIEAVKILARIFSHAEPEKMPVYKETLFAQLEQVLDVPRCVEEMFDRFKSCGVLTEEDHLEIHIKQQAKVEAHGHHKPERSGEERRHTEGRRVGNRGE